MFSAGKNFLSQRNGACLICKSGRLRDSDMRLRDLSESQQIGQECGQAGEEDNDHEG